MRARVRWCVILYRWHFCVNSTPQIYRLIHNAFSNHKSPQQVAALVLPLPRLKCKPQKLFHYVSYLINEGKSVVRRKASVESVKSPILWGDDRVEYDGILKISAVRPPTPPKKRPRGTIGAL